jgi:methylmalonyl-CoA/ethylmalonyl-CoA epimerase
VEVVRRESVALTQPTPASWRFDHLGVVVKTLERGRSRLADLLSISDWTGAIDDPVNGVRLQFGRDPAGLVYELLEPLGQDSPVHSALQGGRAILNHVAYRVPDLKAGAEHFARAGAAPVGEPKPAIAYDGLPIQFFVTPLRFVIELIEAPDHAHAFSFPNAIGSGASG